MSLSVTRIQAADIILGSANVSVTPGDGGGGGGTATMQTVGMEKFVPNFYSPYGGGNPYYWDSNRTTVTLNTHGDEEYSIFKVPPALAGKTVTKAYIYVRSVDSVGTAGTGTFRVGIGRGFDAAGHTTLADDVDYVEYVNGTNLTSSATEETWLVDWESDGNAGTGLTNLVANENIRVSFTVFNGAQVKLINIGSRNSNGLVYVRAHDENDNDDQYFVQVVLGTSDGIFFHPFPFPSILNGFYTSSYIVSGDGAGVKMTAPFDCKASGIFAHLNHYTSTTYPGDTYWRIAVDGDPANDLANVLVTQEQKFIDYPDNRQVVGYQFFDEEVIIPKGTTFYVLVQHQDTTGQLIPYYFRPSYDQSHAADIVKSYKDYLAWNVIPVEISGGVFTELSPDSIYGVGMILSQIKAE